LFFAVHAANPVRTNAASLLQFRVFRFRFVEERDIGVGVFPGSEKVLIGDASFGFVARF